MSNVVSEVRAVYRGDARDQATLKKHGGFIPKYLASTHKDGLEGFIACKNKTEGKLGCNCAGFSEAELFSRARDKFTDTITRNPSLLQEHVIFNKVGLMASALAAEDRYAGHGYQFGAKYLKVFQYCHSEEAIGLTPKSNAIVNKYKIYMSHATVLNSTALGMVPFGGVELAFFTPIRYADLTYLGVK